MNKETPVTCPVQDHYTNYEVSH